MLDALGHPIKSPLVKSAMRALGVKAPTRAVTTRDANEDIYSATAEGPRGEMSFMGFVRYKQEYGPPLSRTTRDTNELILEMIEFAKRGTELPRGVRIGDSLAAVIEKRGKKPRSKSAADYGTACWFYVDGYRLIAAFSRKSNLLFLRAFRLDLGEQKRAAATRKTFVMKVPAAPRKRPTTACTQAAITKTDALLDTYVATVIDLAKAKKVGGLLPATKGLVVALNKLNRQHGDGLIETMEREELCAFIDALLRATGFDPGDDVTEPWREW